jgi:hypothetical protein
LLDDGLAAATFEQRLFHAREAAAQNANNQVIGVVGLRARSQVRESPANVCQATFDAMRKQRPVEPSY